MTHPLGARTARLASLVLFIALAAPVVAFAQEEPSAADRAAAGQAYDRGTAAYLAHDYARAAELFETACRLAPSAPALIQAIRSHEHAGNHLRAGSLALRLEARYGSDRQAARQAHTTLQTASHDFLRVDVTCDASCTVELDGTVEDFTSFFVDPASAHTVVAAFDTGSAPAQTTAGAAGETQTLSFARPAPPPVVTTTVATTTTTTTETATTSEPPPPPAPSSSGLHPAVALTMMGLTLASIGVLAWSAVDMYDGVPAYNANPTQAAYDDGHAREIRTDVMWGVTGALAATSVLLAIFSDWSFGAGSGASERQAAAVSFFAAPTGAGFVLRGGF